MSTKTFLIGYLIILIILFSSIAILYPAPKNTSSNYKSYNSQINITQDMIYNNIKAFFKYSNTNGFIMERRANGTVVNSSKNILDYISAVNFISKFIKEDNNDSYSNNIPIYLNLIHKFESNGGYYSFLSANWKILPNSYFSSSTLADLILMYSNLYSAVPNDTYVQQAFIIYTYLVKNFHDPIHGGYYSEINPSTLAPNPNTNRETNTYGIIAQSYYELYSDTNNATILNQGLQLLVNLASKDYNSINEFFYPFLTESSNSPISSYTSSLPDQIDLVLPILEYQMYNSSFLGIASMVSSQIVTDFMVNTTTPSTSLYNICFSSYPCAHETNGETASVTYFAENYDYRSYSDEYFYTLADQLTMLNYFIENNISRSSAYSNYENNFLNNNFYLLESFFNFNAQLFSTTLSSSLLTPYINFQLLSTLFSLSQYHFSLYYLTSTATFNAPPILPIIMSIALIPEVLVLIIALFDFIKRRKR